MTTKLQNDALNKVHKAIKDGKLIRPSKCESCGQLAKLHGHHEDYTKPLKVQWLCPKCHSIIGNQAIKIQVTMGTLERNPQIIQLYKLGVPQAEIARQFTARGHMMSRQQVGNIIKRNEPKLGSLKWNQQSLNQLSRHRLVGLASNSLSRFVPIPTCTSRFILDTTG